MNQPARPLHLLAKPTGAACNLDCRYCFFLSKESLYPDERTRMSGETLDSYIRQLLEPQGASDVTVAWQGGEPTLMGLEFFRYVMARPSNWMCNVPLPIAVTSASRIDCNSVSVSAMTTHNATAGRQVWRAGRLPCNSGI